MTDPVEVLYFYRTRWGCHDEFVELFRQEPLADPARAVGGRPLHGRRAVDAPLPRRRPGGLGRAGLDHVPRLGRDPGARRRRDRARLYPDQEAFRAEERRRFELLEAHWDVVLEARPLER